jgi:hypothetical protein
MRRKIVRLAAITNKNRPHLGTKNTGIKVPVFLFWEIVVLYQFACANNLDSDKCHFCQDPIGVNSEMESKSG